MLKIKHVEKTFSILIFLDDTKNDAKMYFFSFCCFFAIFLFLKKSKN